MKKRDFEDILQMDTSEQITTVEDSRFSDNVLDKYQIVDYLQYILQTIEITESETENSRTEQRLKTIKKSVEKVIELL